MQEDVLIKKILGGIQNCHTEHVQGFPDGVDKALRGIYVQAMPRIQNEHMDPGYKAASILFLILASSGAIVIDSNGYSFDGSTLRSDEPILEILEKLKERYIWDDNFVAGAIQTLQECDSEKRIVNLQAFCRMYQTYDTLYYSQDEKMQMDYLEKLMFMLSEEDAGKSADSENIPISWDANAWKEFFTPIWDSRDRWRQHEARSQYYQKHVDLVQSGKYVSQSGKMVSISWDAYEMMHHSKMYCHEMTPSASNQVFQTEFEVCQDDCLNVAKRIQEKYQGKTAVLNLANRQNPGGGVYTGSGAQEESCFLRSNYFTALYPFAEYAYQYDLPKAKQQYPLDRDFGGMWSSDITIFRGRELEGYPLLDEPWHTNFIAVAAINRPPVVDINGELRLRHDMVQASLNKIRTIMNIAIDNNVENLVLGALGCGAFKNPPRHIAELFLQVLNEPTYKGRFQHIAFAILSGDLCEIFSDVFKKC